MVRDRFDNRAYEATVDLSGDRAESFVHVPGAVPDLTVNEYYAVDEAMRAHPDVNAVRAARGITDLSRVLVEIRTYRTALMPERYRDRRPGWCDIW